MSLLRSLPDSDERLVLFEADFYNPVEFEKAIEGCEFVFHVATPLIHTPNSKVNGLSLGTLFYFTYHCNPIFQIYHVINQLANAIVVLQDCKFLLFYNATSQHER